MWNTFEREEHLLELGELKHQPLRPPRVDHVGENVFAHEWEVFMLTDRSANEPANIRLENILEDMDRLLTQRHASVAATFITWLGTNCGQSYLHEASQLGSRGRIGNDKAFVAAWAIENMRRRGINHGRRTVEALLEDDSPNGELFAEMVGLRQPGDFTVEDLETLDHVAAWLGTDQGYRFCRRCEHLIQTRNKFSTEETVRIIAGAVTKADVTPFMERQPLKGQL